MTARGTDGGERRGAPARPAAPLAPDARRTRRRRRSPRRGAPLARPVAVLGRARAARREGGRPPVCHAVPNPTVGGWGSWTSFSCVCLCAHLPLMLWSSNAGHHLLCCGDWHVAHWTHNRLSESPRESYSDFYMCGMWRGPPPLGGRAFLSTRLSALNSELCVSDFCVGNLCFLVSAFVISSLRPLGLFVSVSLCCENEIS